MRFGDVRSPIPSTDGNDRKLGNDDRATDGGRDFLGTLDTQANMTKPLPPRSA